MSTNEIVVRLDAEIARLRSAVGILKGTTAGRAKVDGRRKRVMSAATRALIAEKMRQAWKRGRKSHK
jgi:hypothetical protein